MVHVKTSSGYDMSNKVYSIKPTATSVMKMMTLAGIGMFALASCAGPIDTVVTLNYYEINGNSLKQIDREIYDKGPRINDGERAVAISNIKMTPDIKMTPEIAPPR
jgi:predicted secreted Zn-dependent protease